MSSVHRPRGRLFQIRGPTAPKLLSPKLLCVRGTAHMLSEEDRTERRLQFFFFFFFLVIQRKVQQHEDYRLIAYAVWQFAVVPVSLADDYRLVANACC